MWLETMTGLLGDVPARSTTQLGELRAQDRKSRDLKLLIEEEENKLCEAIKTAQAEVGYDFDEAPFVAKAQELMQRRAALVQLLEEKGKLAQGLYDAIDAKIEMFDERTQSIQHLVVCDPNEATQHKKKKRRGLSLPADVFEETAVDPNEPVYCTCRMVSFGKMVGCENAECTIEWFHLACVGLTDPTPECWYCPDCCVKLGIANY